MRFDPSMPILVVDDNPAILDVLVRLLKKIGFATVDVAADGGAALAKMQIKKYKLVISDWQMEPMDGATLLQYIRSSAALANTPFIMVTVHSEASKVISAKRLGVNGYLTKPFSTKELSTKIEQAVW
jgi:two-component system chemotaxis response regulator CheY